MEDLDSGTVEKQIDGTIELRNVWFAYQGDNWVIKDVSFKIKKGETVAFVGETGAGKSTIINLINGFYKIQKGEILIDGINIEHYKLKNLRQNIAVVPQDVFLFSGTIRDNITLNDAFSDDQVTAALKLSCATPFVSNLPQGIAEPVLERCNTLSSGQRQLLSFARAIIRNPSILVLDEATANIDPFTEQQIQKAMSNISKDRTTLIIAHRLSTVQNADKIIVMRYGQVLEIGNHHGLIQNANGYYRKMVAEGAGINNITAKRTAI